MFWNIYIADVKNKVMGKTEKKRLFIPNTTTGDNRFACQYSAKHFGVKEDLVLCIPTPRSELD